MSLFTSDLFRQFGFGFAAGALLIGAATVDDWTKHLESPAQAAVPYEAPQASEEFQIEPLEIAR